MVAVFYILHRDWSREEADPTTEKREVEREREDRKRQKRIVKDSKRKEKVGEREREKRRCAQQILPRPPESISRTTPKSKRDEFTSPQSNPRLFRTRTIGLRPSSWARPEANRHKNQPKHLCTLIEPVQ